MILEVLARRYFRVGDVTMVERGSGRTWRLGDGTGPPLVVEIAPGTVARVAINPPLRFGEAYMDGAMRLLQGSVYDLLHTVGRNFQHDPAFQRKPPWRAASYAVQRRIQ